MLDSGANKSAIVAAINELAAMLGEHARQRLTVTMADESKKVKEAPPQSLVTDEGSLVAMCVKMSKMGWRLLALYDEGDGLFKALKYGESGSFSPATMAKLHNGSGITRDVNKDENRFHCYRTCFSIGLVCHYEEWEAFLDAADTLGMAPRFQAFHTEPVLKSGEDTLDRDMYRRRDEAADSQPQSAQASVLDVIASSLSALDDANLPKAIQYNAKRHYIPEYLSPDAASLFCQRFDKMAIEQEWSYLIDAKKFSQCAKFKSQPWRLAMVLSKWEAAANPDKPAHDKVSLTASEVALTIFDDFLTPQSTVLHPKSNLCEWVKASPHRESIRQRFPLLHDYLILGGDAVRDFLGTSRPLGVASGPNAAITPETLGFDSFWGTLSPTERARSFTAASWVLSKSSLVATQLAVLVKKLANKVEEKSYTPTAQKQTAFNAFRLLTFAGLGCVHGNLEQHGAVVFKKAKHPEAQSGCLIFKTLLHFFGVSRTDPESYASEFLKTSESLAKSIVNLQTISAGVFDATQSNRILADLQQGDMAFESRFLYEGKRKES